jgi:hypothetical protein
LLFAGDRAPGLAGRIHAFADCRPEFGRVRPFLENTIGERREEALHFGIEAAAPATVKALLEDVALLDGLVAEKLKAEAEKIAAEGWK